jgi:hypothetical protein
MGTVTANTDSITDAPGFLSPKRRSRSGCCSAAPRAVPLEAARALPLPAARPALSANRGAPSAQCRRGGVPAPGPRGSLGCRGVARPAFSWQILRLQLRTRERCPRSAERAALRPRRRRSGRSRDDPAVLPGQARPVRSRGLGRSKPSLRRSRLAGCGPSRRGGRERAGRWGRHPGPARRAVARLRLSQRPGGAGEPRPAAERGSEPSRGRPGILKARQLDAVQAETQGETSAPGAERCQRGGGSGANLGYSDKLFKRFLSEALFTVKKNAKTQPTNQTNP